MLLFVMVLNTDYNKIFIKGMFIKFLLFYIQITVR